MKKYITITFLLLGLQIVAQCFPDRHSTNWFDAWISCETTTNPNPARGISHWIKYDLGALYTLKTSQIWNINDPAHLNYGVKKMIIDISVDGSTWEYKGTVSLPVGDGKTTYEGTTGLDFDSTLARHVLFTVEENYGGDCAGIGEMKINLDSTVVVIDENIGFKSIVYPNPFRDNLNIKLYTLYPNEPIKITITDILGKTIFVLNKLELKGENDFALQKEIQNLSKGIYLLNIQHHTEEINSFKIIKQ